MALQKFSILYIESEFNEQTITQLDNTVKLTLFISRR